MVEESLSLDNIFVIATVMAYFRIPAESQHRLLYWGVLGALVMRFVFIISGLALVQRFTWTTYIFGGILIVTALKMMIQKEEELHPERNGLVRLFQRFMPVSCEFQAPRSSSAPPMAGTRRRCSSRCSWSRARTSCSRSTRCPR